MTWSTIAPTVLASFLASMVEFTAAHARSALDPIAFLASFKAVVLEGIEVVFVVVALGMKPGLLLPAASGAGLALLLVVALGLALHRPLARIPENLLKFVVGVMLTALGTYWAGEGMGIAWPAGDASILALIVVLLGLAAILVQLCARIGPPLTPVGSRAAVNPPQPRLLPSIGRELLGLFIDDLPLAAGIAAWVGATALVQALHLAATDLACGLFPAGLAAVLAISAWRRAARSA